jgi:hypothetical protein
MHPSSLPTNSLQNFSNLPNCNSPALIQNSSSVGDKKNHEIAIVNSFLADYVIDGSKQVLQKSTTGDEEVRKFSCANASSLSSQNCQMIQRVHQGTINRLSPTIDLKFQSTSIPLVSVTLDPFFQSSSSTSLFSPCKSSLQLKSNQQVNQRVDEEVQKRDLNLISHIDLFNN